MSKRRRTISIASVADLDPTSIPGCVTWLKSDRGITLGTGSKVAAWADQSGQGRHFTQVTSANQPTFAATGMNGGPSLHFLRTSGQFLIGPSYSALTGGGEIFIAMKIGATTQNNTNRFGSVTNPSVIYGRQYYDNWGSATSRRGPSPGTIPDNSTRIYNVWSVAGDWVLRDNGTVLLTDTTNTVGWDTVGSLLAASTGGGVGATANDCFEGDIAEVIIYNRKLTTTQRDTVTTGLQRQYNFGPASIPDCALWLKADKGVTLSGSNVTFWADQSGHSRNFQQSSAGNQPTFVASGINSKPSIAFSAASSQYLNGPSFASLVSAGDAFLIFKRNSGVDVGIWRFGSFAAQSKITSAGVITDPFASASKVYTSSSYTISAGVAHLYNAQTQINGQYVARLDQTYVLDSGIGAASTFGWETAGSLLGASCASGVTPNIFMDGQIAQLVIYSRPLTDIERAAVAAEMKAEWGVT